MKPIIAFFAYSFAVFGDRHLIDTYVLTQLCPKGDRHPTHFLLDPSYFPKNSTKIGE